MEVAISISLIVVVCVASFLLGQKDLSQKIRIKEALIEKEKIDKIKANHLKYVHIKQLLNDKSRSNGKGRKA